MSNVANATITCKRANFRSMSVGVSVCTPAPRSPREIKGDMCAMRSGGSTEEVPKSEITEQFTLTDTISVRQVCCFSENHFTEIILSRKLDSMCTVGSVSLSAGLETLHMHCAHWRPRTAATPTDNTGPRGGAVAVGA